jgi:hypothetical protein
MSVTEPKRCLICFWHGWLSVAPSVLNTAIRLADRGWRVDIITLDPVEQKFPPLPSLPGNVKIIQLKRFRNVFAGLQRNNVLGRPRIWGRIVTVLDALDFLRTAGAVAWRKAYDLTVGIDMMGMLLAGCARRKAVAFSVFWSLELESVGAPSVSIRGAALAAAQRLIRSATMILVQDRDRAEALAQLFEFDESRVRLIPASAMGLPSQRCPAFLHKRLHIDPGLRIVLSAGMICNLTLSPALAKSTINWPDGYLLVFHEREIRDPAEAYLQNITELGGNRVALSLNPVQLDQVDKVYSSAFIGIVMYSTEYGPNVAEIAHASGKLSYFLRNGIPIIVNANPSLMSFIGQWQCGLVAKDFNEIGCCITQIAQRYESYRNNALRCFTEFLDFRIGFDAAFDGLLANRTKA